MSAFIEKHAEANIFFCQGYVAEVWQDKFVQLVLWKFSLESQQPFFPQRVIFAQIGRLCGSKCGGMSEFSLRMLAKVLVEALLGLFQPPRLLELLP